jgi:hypothetical protein
MIRCLYDFRSLGRSPFLCTARAPNPRDRKLDDGALSAMIRIEDADHQTYLEVVPTALIWDHTGSKLLAGQKIVGPEESAHFRIAQWSSEIAGNSTA